MTGRRDLEPPRLAAWVTRVLTPRSDRGQLTSELHENFVARHEQTGASAARWWYRRQVGAYAIYVLGSTRPHEFTMRNPLQDVAYSIRGLVRRPLFALTVLSTVALGIAATTAGYAVVHSVLIEALPYPEPNRIYRIVTQRSDGSEWGFSMADYVALEEHQRSFSEVAAYDPGTLTLQTDDGSYRIGVQAVTPSYFTILGLTPALGRTFALDESSPDAAFLAVVSHGFWERHLGSRRDLTNLTISLGGLEMEVVGVLPPTRGPEEERAEVFYNLRVETPGRKGPFVLRALGRVAPDTGAAAAGTELRAINDRIFPLWQDSWPDENSTWGLRPLKAVVVGEAGQALVPLLAAVVLLLLIAATNAVNLLLARAIERRRELAIRAALGSSRIQLIQTLAAEGIVLAMLSALLGVAGAYGLVELTRAYAGGYVPRLVEVGLDAPVLVFWALVSAGSLVLLAVLPTAQAAGSNLLSEVRQAGVRATGSTRVRSTRRLLVGAQFAIAMPLLIGGGLLFESLWQLGRVDPGFEPDNLLTARVTLAGEYADRDAVGVAWATALERIDGLPGVASVGLATGLPPDNPAFGNNFVLEDVPIGPDETQFEVPWVVATSEYFDAMGIPLVEGRLFELSDSAESRVALVDERWADRFFPGESAVGRRFRHGGCTIEGCDWWTVIGVVGEVVYEGLDAAGSGIMYIDARLFRSRTGYVVVRTETDPLAALDPVRSIVRELDSRATITSIATGRDLLSSSLQGQRYLTWSVVVFAAVALALSVVGIYGVMAYFVQDHRREFGIRIALGGTPHAVTRLIVRDGMRLVAAGIAIGLFAAFGTTRFMASLLFGAQPTEPSVFSLVTASVATFAAIACLVPAIRAARLDPAETLRDD